MQFQYRFRAFQFGLRVCFDVLSHKIARESNYSSKWFRVVGGRGSTVVSNSPMNVVFGLEVAVVATEQDQTICEMKPPPLS